ncbi:MAG: Glycerol-3-phosphate transporter [Holosporales bacterium]
MSFIDIDSKLEDQRRKDQKKAFDYWRVRIMLSMMMGYAFFYIIRHAYPAIIKPMEMELGYTKTQIGAILGLGSILYGVGKSFAGLIGDRLSAKWLMAVGLFMSGVCTFYFGLCDNLTGFMVAYTLNMCFQSLGWPSCARLLTHWFSSKELATKWAIWNSSQQIGGAAIMILSGWIMIHHNWRYVLFVSAIISMIMAVILFFCMQDTPESLGLPSIEEHHGLKPEESDEDMSLWDILMHKVLTNKLVWYVCMANFFVYITRIGILTWGPTLLQEVKQATMHSAANLTAVFDTAGIFGGIFAGYLSDKIFKGYRGRVGAILMVLMAISIALLWITPPSIPLFIPMMLIGFVTTGPQILVGVAAVDFSSKKTAGVATGLTGTVGYLGTAVATAGFGALVQYCGWQYTFLCMVVSCLMGAFFFALTWNHRSKILG